MGQVVGDLLPLAVGVAISPIPVIAVVLMLLAPKAGGTSAGFLLGWTVGIGGVTTLFLLLASTLDLGGSDQPSTTASWVKLVLGVLLLLLAVRQWQSRPEPGAPAATPGGMAADAGVTAVKAAGLGVALSAVNPKNLLLCVAAGATIAGGGLSGVEEAWSVVVYTVIAASTIAVPVLGYAVGRKRMAGPLESLHTWLTMHNAAVMGTLLLVIGVVLIGKGLGGLFGARGQPAVVRLRQRRPRPRPRPGHVPRGDPHRLAVGCEGDETRPPGWWV